MRKELKAGRIPVFTTEIPRLKAFEHAAAAGIPVSQLSDDRARRAWQSYAAVGKEIEKYAKS